MDLLDRLVKNWKTSSVAIMAAIAVILPWFGIEVTTANLSTLIIGLEALMLLFAKD